MGERTLRHGGVPATGCMDVVRWVLRRLLELCLLGEQIREEFTDFYDDKGESGCLSTISVIKTG
jgi:hypothetical protein